MEVRRIPKDAAQGETAVISNQSKSDLFLQRLCQIFETCNPAQIPAYNSRPSRKWLADQIGCSPSTLTTSYRLRSVLEAWERKHRSDMVSTARRAEDDDTNVAFLGKKKPTAGQIFRIPVTVSRSIKGQTLEVPTLIWEEGLDEWVGDYARHLRFASKLAYSSVEEVVKKLRIFRRFQHELRVPFEHVNDDFLLAWQGAMASSPRSSERRRDECISTVHDFFKWAEDRGLLKNHIQMAARHEYKDLSEDYVFPISSTQVMVRGRHGQSYAKWVSTLTGGRHHHTYGMRHTPTSAEVLRLGDEVELHQRNSVRNKLIMDWALCCGARVSEIVQIKESDFPGLNSIGELFGEGSNGANYEVWVERKNRGRSLLRAPIDLVLRTVEYLACDEDRQKIIAARLNGACTNDRFVFLSEKTGSALTTDSVTRIFGHFFRKVGIKKANIHRLRAKYITEVIESQLDRLAEGGVDVDPTSNWQETVLVMATQLMGHSHPISLVPYLNEILQRRATKDGKVHPRSIEARERAVDDLVRQTASRFKHHAGLAAAARLIGESRHAEAREVVREVLEQLDELVPK
ncbi:tyrosine-type recombinase/integrase [Mesorhizobium sp. ANAO-SY3R2]|uniref:tyrosine-type recombinase/integrase n=1 Tax=Mesorhizobium sp. ANAO-SY3R2 TaxID=3166644 RepID=UPI0036734273